MEDEKKTNGLDKRGFQGTIGISSVIALVLAIVLPLTMGNNNSSNDSNNGGGDNVEERPPIFDGDLGDIFDDITLPPFPTLPYYYKKTFDNSIDAGNVMTTTTEGLTESKGTGNSTTSSATPASTFIIENLSANTMYFSGYTNYLYHYDQEFKDGKSNSFDILINSIHESLQVIENAPVLDDYVTVEEYQTGTQDLEAYLNSLTVDYNEGQNVLMNLYNEFLATRFGENFGIMGVSYFEMESGEIQIEAGYKGTALVKQEQLTTTPETLPIIYQFKGGLLSEIENYYIELYEYKYDVLNNAFDEATFNTITGITITYAEYITLVQDLKVVINEFGVTDITNKAAELILYGYKS